MATLRLQLGLNAGPRTGQALATVLVAPTADAVLKAAVNKLRLKKKDAVRARLFVWGSGVELDQSQSSTTTQECLHNDDLVVVCLGEPYAGPRRAVPSAAHDGPSPADAAADSEQEVPEVPSICGSDDSGRVYDSLGALWVEQRARHLDYYAANAAWWESDGYGGATDDEAMIGDGGSAEDIEHSLRLIDTLRADRPQWQLHDALDVGAGVGRVTKHLLLRRCERACLLEPSDHWHKQSRRYLGKKRAQRCAFVCERLERHEPWNRWDASGKYDLVWVQWTLQYLVDAHVVAALRRLAGALHPSALIIIKENRPCAALGKAEDQFHVDTPEGAHGRYDVTRPDEHHRWLFRCAGLDVIHSEGCVGGECTAWVLQPAGRLSTAAGAAAASSTASSSRDRAHVPMHLRLEQPSLLADDLIPAVDPPCELEPAQPQLQPELNRLITPPDQPSRVDDSC
jgi:protein N-terminal methyltransferase